MIRGHFDGASRGNPGLAGAGAVIYEDDKIVWRCAQPLGMKTNNEAEYMALGVLADELARRGLKWAEVCGDSKLVISQISGQWKIKEPRLQALARPIMKKLAELGASYRWVRREKNAEADAMSNKALDDGAYVEDRTAGAAAAFAPQPQPAEPALEASLHKALVSEAPVLKTPPVKTPAPEAPRRMTVTKAARRIWIVEDRGVQYAVDMAHGCCTCEVGRKSGRCPHVELVLQEDPFLGGDR